MEEIWKSIPGYEGYYEISNTGKIRSLTRTIMKSNGRSQTFKGKELIPQLSAFGYYKIILSKNQIKKQYLIHKLVAITFIPNPNNLPIVNHKDENKTNNNVENLEWCTYEYNNNYGTIKQRHIETISKPIIMCNKDTHKPIKEFLNTKIAAQELGSPNSHSNIWRVLKGERQTALGYWWKYKEEDE